MIVIPGSGPVSIAELPNNTFQSVRMVFGIDAVRKAVQKKDFFFDARVRKIVGPLAGGLPPIVPGFQAYRPVVVILLPFADFQIVLINAAAPDLPVVVVLQIATVAFTHTVFRLEERQSIQGRKPRYFTV